MFSILLAFLPSALVVLSLIKRNKTLYTLSQMGSLESDRSEVACSDAAEKTKVFDKLCYMSGVINVGLTAWILGAFPTKFHLWHTPKAVFLTLLRWYTFRKSGQHYLLYDFCYFANALTLLYIWVFPHSATLFQMIFVVSLGPLAWTSFAFQHSLIFHSHPHMTSVFIHLSPMFLVFGLRWHPTPTFTVCDDYPVCKVHPPTMVWNGTIRFYIWWIVLYYVWVFVILHNRIKSRGYQTLFDRVVKTKIHFVTTVSSNVFVQKLLYVLVHLFCGLLGMSMAALMWHSYYAQVVFIISICCTVSYNAAGFYFTVFLETYEKELAAKRPSSSPLRRDITNISNIQPISPTGPSLRDR